MARDWVDKEGVNLLTEETFQAHAAAMKLVLDGRLSGACHSMDASSVACT